jgi:hypothetical protein
MKTPRRTAYLATIAGLALLLPVKASAGKDLADYPLRVEIIRSVWGHNSTPPTPCRSSIDAGLSCPMFTGWGVGSVLEGQTIRGFDFKYSCSFALRRTSGASHPAKWKKPLRRLAVLVARTGKEGKYDECLLATTMQPGAGVVGSQRPGARPQDDDRATLSGSPGRQPEKAAFVSVAVWSSPDGADIEVDGRFMGSTPSSLELTPGERVVVVRKPGFKPWERRVYLAGGRIRLNAELEGDEAK